MRIYKEKNEKQDLLKKYLLNFNFKKLYVFLLIFFIGGVFFAPLGLLRSNSRYVRLGAKAFHHNLGILDKKYLQIHKLPYHMLKIQRFYNSFII